MNFDLQILKFLNSLVSDKSFFYHLATALVGNALLISGPLFACLAIVSLSQSTPLHKSKIVLGYAGVLVSVAVSVFCQGHIAVHIRPILDQSLNLPNIVDWPPDAFCHRLYSFPSDTATLYFGVCAVVSIQNRGLGVLCLILTWFTVGFSRISLGLHYPSDILSGLVLAFSLVYAFTHLKAAQAPIQRFMLKYDAKSILFHVVVVLFCAEAYSRFANLQMIYQVLERLGKGGV